MYKGKAINYTIEIIRLNILIYFILILLIIYFDYVFDKLSINILSNE